MQQTPPAPPAPQAVVVRPGITSPRELYQAFTAQREQLGDQLETLQETRTSLSEKLTDPMVAGADRVGLESRISALDARIAALDKQVAVADQQVAQSAGVPGAALTREQERNQRNDGPPQELVVLSGLFIVVVMFPISIAFARRIWRRGSSAVAAIPGELMERMSRLDQAVESIAIEVERIGEGQRFMTRVFTDANANRALGTPAAEPIRQNVRESVPVRKAND